MRLLCARLCRFRNHTVVGGIDSSRGCGSLGPTNPCHAAPSEATARRAEWALPSTVLACSEQHRFRQVHLLSSMAASSLGALHLLHHVAASVSGVAGVAGSSGSRRPSAANLRVG
eukprot:scaffold36068_cov70-Phaeocystis_antarctica.AAC.3